MANGDIHKLGTLWLGGTKRRLPLKPWSPDTKVGEFGYGDTHVFREGLSISIGNTDVDDSFKIRWVEVNKSGKKLLIADRNLITSVSWNELNSQNLIKGKQVTIDGRKYLLRVLTGARKYRNNDDLYRGGELPNEWDEIICNEANLPGLIKPSSEDLEGYSYITSKRMNGDHNKLWNWNSCYSVCQEIDVYNDGIIQWGWHTKRGSGSAQSWSRGLATQLFQLSGWRPVLEVLDGLVISGKDEDLGNKTRPFGITYNVSNPDRNALTIKEIVNGSVLRTFNSNMPSYTNSFLINSETWRNLPLNYRATARLEVTDSDNNKAIRTFTFTKTNAAPSAIPVEPKGDLANLAITDTINPVLVWRFEDEDPNDAQSAYQVFVLDTNNSTIHNSGKIASSQSFYIVPDLNWATRYKWRVMVWDKYDLESGFSSYQFFLPKRRPNVTDVEPGSSNVEEPAGTGTSPEFSWRFEDLDQQAQSAYQLRIYDTKDVLIYDSGRIEKTINQHKIPEGILTEGTIYYAVVTVWDPFGLNKDSEKAYFVTNSTPTAPTLTSPANTYRTGLRPTFEGLIGTDKENDPQQFIIQISQDEKFEQHVLELSSMNERKGWQVSDGSQWYDLAEEGVDNSYEGKPIRYTLQVDLDEGRTYYWRLAAIDANTKARGKWSSTRCVRCGNTLQFKLKNPISTGNTAARRILIAADYYMAQDGINKAQMKIEVTNNALDTNPTWEDATSAYQNADYFTFSNTTKTAQQYALDIRVTFTANDSLGNIEMRGLGFSFD